MSFTMDVQGSGRNFLVPALSLFLGALLGFPLARLTLAALLLMFIVFGFPLPCGVTDDYDVLYIV
jgi:hypothetical protein